MWSRIAHSGRSVAGKFLLLNLGVLAAVLCAVGVVSVRVSSDEFGNLRGQRMIAVAENVASTPIVRDQLDNRDVERVLAPEVDRAVNLSGADLAEIVGPDGIVLASSDPSRIGVGGDLGPSDATTGRAWSGDLDIAGAHSIVGHVPVLDVDGNVLAVVSVSEGYPSVWELLTDGGPQLLLYLGIGAALGLVGSYLLARRLDRDTRGLEVAEIASLADHREALLHSIREGVVAVNNEGEITVLNDSAQDLLGLPADAVGRPRRRRRPRPRRARLPALRIQRARRRHLHPRPGARLEPSAGIQPWAPHRNGDDDARLHRARLHAEPAHLAQERHRHAPRPDARVRQSAAHHFGSHAARRVRRGDRADRDADPPTRRDQRRRDAPHRRSRRRRPAHREDHAGRGIRCRAGTHRRFPARRARSRAVHRCHHDPRQPARQRRRRLRGQRRSRR